jgi:hypothetical protein
MLGTILTIFSAFSLVGAQWTQNEILRPDALDAADWFARGTGYGDFAVSGTKLAVGAAGDDGVGNVGNNRGVVYTFQWDGTNWIEDSTVVRPAELEDVDVFGASVSMFGDRMVVGAQTDDGDGNTGTNTGAVYVFDWVNGAWSQSAIIRPSSVDGSLCGRSSYLYGNKLAIGCTGYMKTTIAHGRVYLYSFDGSSWVEEQFFDPENDAAYGSGGDQFGYRIKMDDTKLIITSYDDDWTDAQPDTSKGALYAYDWNVGTNQWELNSILRPSELDLGDRFGYCADFDGNKLAVGAFSDDGTGNALADSGAVHTFTWNGANWVQGQSLRGSQLGTSDSFGRSCSLNGNYLVVGAYNDDGATDSLSNAGAAYVYKWNGTGWIESQIIRPSELDVSDKFGGAILITDGNLFINSEDDGVSNNEGAAGALYHFILPPCSTHFSCDGTQLAGYLPYCNSVSGRCEPSGLQGTCSSVLQCNDKITTAKAKKNAIAKVTQTVTTTNNTLSRQAARKLYTDTKATTTITQQLYAQISSTETATFSDSLLTASGSEQAMLDGIKATLCGPVAELCTVTLAGGGGGRLLQSSGQISVILTYTIDSTSYDSLPDGSFDSPTFEESLATALGITVNDITIIDNAGTITIEYVVAEESNGSDPLSEENFDALNTLNADLAAVESTIVSELGISATAISDPVIDKCGDRDCNGRGTCNPDTGVCACSDTNYWGVNCETLVDCGSGTKDSVTAYCICPYPSYGQRCQNTAQCDQC